MNQLIDEIITEMKRDLGINRGELEIIIDSQFRTLKEHLESRDIRVVNLKHLGKFRPTKPFLKKVQGNEVFEESKGDNNGDIQLQQIDTGDKGNGDEKSSDLC